MKLTIKERLLMSSFYPREGNMMTQTLVKDIIKKVSVTQEEMKEISLKTTQSGFKWDGEKAKEKDVEFTEAELTLLKEQVDKLDKGSKITQEILNLCIKIKEVVFRA